MGPRDTKRWVREEIIDAIDRLITEKSQAVDGLDFDEHRAFVHERGRVAKLFGMWPRG